MKLSMGYTGLAAVLLSTLLACATNGSRAGSENLASQGGNSRGFFIAPQIAPSAIPRRGENSAFTTQQVQQRSKHFLRVVLAAVESADVSEGSTSVYLALQLRASQRGPYLPVFRPKTGLERKAIEAFMVRHILDQQEAPSDVELTGMIVLGSPEKAYSQGCLNTSDGGVVPIAWAARMSFRAFERDDLRLSAQKLALNGKSEIGVPDLSREWVEGVGVRLGASSVKFSPGEFPYYDDHEDEELAQLVPPQGATLVGLFGDRVVAQVEGAGEVVYFLGRIPACRGFEMEEMAATPILESEWPEKRDRMWGQADSREPDTLAFIRMDSSDLIGDASNHAGAGWSRNQMIATAIALDQSGVVDISLGGDAIQQWGINTDPLPLLLTGAYYH